MNCQAHLTVFLGSIYGFPQPWVGCSGVHEASSNSAFVVTTQKQSAGTSELYHVPWDNEHQPTGGPDRGQGTLPHRFVLGALGVLDWPAPVYLAP